MKTLFITALASATFVFLFHVDPSTQSRQSHPQVTTTNPYPAKTWYKMDVLATAYCPCSKCCGSFADGKTAMGRDAWTKGVAVDKTLIPLGALVNVPNYGTVMADDVGGAIKKNHIDVRFNSHQEALNWGRKYITIYYHIPG